jgi:hypothetical protein
MRSRLPFDVWLSLAGPIAVLLVFAAGSGLFVRGLYRDAPFFASTHGITLATRSVQVDTPVHSKRSRTRSTDSSADNSGAGATFYPVNSDRDS